MGKLSTHVLDTANGQPAAGLKVDLFFLGGASRQHLGSFRTNSDGRTDSPLLSDEDMVTGVFELVFHVGEYYDKLAIKLPEPMFLDAVPVRFGIARESDSYHVPLLVSPYGYSTYRGS